MTRPRASLLLSLFVSVAMLAATGITSAADFRSSDVTGQGYGDVTSGLVGPQGRSSPSATPRRCCRITWAPSGRILSG